MADLQSWVLVLRAGLPGGVLNTRFGDELQKLPLRIAGRSGRRMCGRGISWQTCRAGCLWGALCC